MKKRLLSALLALALVFVLLPTTALAGVTTENDYDISINGIGWKFDKEDNSDAYIPVYFYGNDPSRYFFSTEADEQWASNSNLKLTKEGNTVTITIRPKKNHIPGNTIEFTLEKKSTTSGEPYDFTPCIEMGKNNNLVITGKGTLNITRDEKNGIGAALCSEVGDITITDGITVKANFLKQVSNSTVGNAISVQDHNLIISGKNTKVEARNSSCNFRDLYDVSAAVCVKNGEIKVSDGATLSAINNFTNSYTSQYSYYSRAISGSSSNPCTLTVTGENSCVIAETDNSLGKAYGHVNFRIDGAKIEVGTSSPAQTITDINNIKNYKYAKISVPALQRTSDVLIAGKNAVVGVETSIPSANGSGTYFYDQASKTLTLNNVTITSGTNAIQFAAAGTYTVKLEGTNKISNVSNGISVTDDKYITSLNVTITGTGSLDISAKGLAINMKKGDLKFENTGEIKLTTSNISPTHNVLSVSGNITIADMEKYKVEGIVQDNTKDGGDTVTLSEASHLKGYQNPDGTAICLKTITITPTPAKDSTIRYNGTTLKQGETIRNGGTATVDSKNNTITLKNFNGTAALSFEATLADSTLVLEGTNTLSSIVTTQKGLTISGSGSLTVGSIRVPNNTQHTANLTITGGAHVTVNRPSEDKPAVEVSGNLTVTGDGTQLSAECTAATNPAIEVGGNASFTGSTVTITNNSTTQGKSGEYSYEVSTGLYVGGTLDIKNAAKVTSTVIGGNAIYAKGDITISGDNTEVKATNDAYKFSAISTNKTVNISDNSTVKAENLKRHQGDDTGKTDPPTGKEYNACPAITGKIANKNTQNKLHIEGFTTSSPGTSHAKDGVVSNLDIAPSSVEPFILHYNVTITRGDEVVRTPSPVDIDGHTLLNDTYYTITNGSTVAEGSENNYNAFYDSVKKTLKLNNAKISTTTNNAAIKIGEDAFATYTITVTGTNELQGNYNHCIESYSSFKINGDGTLEMTNGSNTTASVIYCGPDKSLTIGAEVIFKNNSNSGVLLGMVEKDAYSFAEGYNVYASTNVSGSPLEAYDAAKSSTYKYLCVTTKTLETGGGSTHEHVFSTSWESNADYHWHKCTVQGCTEVSDKEAHVYTNTWWKNSNGNHGRTCDKCRHEGEIHEFRKYYDFADETYHVERCGYLNCTYVGRQETHSYDSFGVCKCGYSPNGLPAPPSLQGVAPTSENGTDGKILNSNIGMEYAQNLNGPWTKWNEHSNITGLSAGTYYVRYTKTDERFPDNQVATVEVPAYTPGGDPTPDVPAAPTGLVGVAPTSENGNGKITGTTAQMEYATSLEGDWTACANDSTDVPAGKYYVRMKKTDNTPAGEAVEVTVPAYSGTGEIVPPTPDNPGTIVIIRPAEEEKPAQQPNPSTGANDLVGLAVAAAVAAALGSAVLLRKHD